MSPRQPATLRLPTLTLRSFKHQPKGHMFQHLVLVATMSCAIARRHCDWNSLALTTK